MEQIKVKCPHCDLVFKKGGIHHHIQRKHEGKIINYKMPPPKIWSEAERQNLSKKVKLFFSENPYTHSDEVKKVLSEKARKSNHRRLRRSMRDYICKDGSVVVLDSSWEETLAIKLDKENIKWTRPDPISYVDKNGLKRNYFPDFYLPEFDLFLDPKNPYAFRVQKDKIDCITKQIKNLLILTSIEDINNITGHVAQFGRVGVF